MRHSRAQIDRLIHRFRPSRWLRPSPPARVPHGPPPSPAAEEFDKLLAKTREEAVAAQSEAVLVSARMQEVVDHVDVTRPLIAYIPYSELEPLAAMWSGLAGGIAIVRTSVDQAFADSDLVSGSASLTSSSTTSIISHSMGIGHQDDAFTQVWEDYVAVISRPDLNDEVRGLIRVFGLHNAPPGEKAPLELFDMAQSAFSSPVSGSNPASTSLLPMRECIQATLTQLLRRRPTQEQTGSSEKEKVKSIARQLRRANVGDEVVEAWADEWHRLNDKDLSSSKRAQLSRKEWGLRLTTATRFLHSLLSQLDPTKLRT